MSESGSQSGSGNWGSIALIALLVASLAAGIFVYRARTPDLALEVTSFPKESNAVGVAQFDFFVRFDEPEALVEIVGRDQVVVKTLDPALAVEDGQPISCIWDGGVDEGGLAPPGRYRLRVTLPSEDRQMVFPRRFDIEPNGRFPDETYALTEPCEAEARS